MSKIGNQIGKNKFVIIAILIAMVIGHYAIQLKGPLILAPDSTGYHSYAVNIVNHGIYSLRQTPPFKEKFIREPGYPLFLAGIFTLVDGCERVEYIQNYNLEMKSILEEKTEIEIVKYIQLVLLIITIILLYKTVAGVVPIRVRKLYIIMNAMYYPYIVYCTYILREALVTFFLSLYAYLLAKYIKDRKEKYIFVATAIIALATLIWQAMLPLTIAIGILVIMGREKLAKKATTLIKCIILYCLILMPWIMYVYQYYPDYRIAKTIGTSLTHEIMDYASALILANELGWITDEEINRIGQKEIYRVDSDVAFERSFNGWYSDKADSIRAEINLSFSENYIYEASNAIGRLKNLMILKNWYPIIDTVNGIDQEKTELSIILNGISVLMMFLGLYGLLVVKKRGMVYLIPYIMFILLYNIIGSETRRFLPYQPFYILMASVGVVKIESIVNGHLRG